MCVLPVLPFLSMRWRGSCKFDVRTGVQALFKNPGWVKFWALVHLGSLMHGRARRTQQCPEELGQGLGIWGNQGRGGAEDGEGRTEEQETAQIGQIAPGMEDKSKKSRSGAGEGKGGSLKAWWRTLQRLVLTLIILVWRRNPSEKAWITDSL